METVNEEVLKRLHFLEELKGSLERQLKRLPEGSLRISFSNGSAQYFRRTEEGEKRRQYIPQKQEDLIRGLAQRDYYRKVIRTAEDEIRVLRRLIASYPGRTVEEVWPVLPEARRALTEPVYEPDGIYAEKWQSKEYERKGFAEGYPEYYTDRGERVRSKSEMIIANQLLREGVPYRYEYPLILPGFGTFSPDFTVLHVRLRKEIIWDHFGMIDDPDYANNAMQKVTAYNRCGYYEGENLVLTYETSRMPLNVKDLQRMIRRCFL